MPRRMENSTVVKTSAASGPFTGPGLAMGSMVSSQLGIAFAVPLMVAHGSFGISALRLGFAALFCLAWVRPNVLRFDRRQWVGAFALGVAMAMMTMCFFTAARLIPMGPAITIDFLGPLGVAVLALRGWPRLVLPLAAAFGVLAVSYGSHGKLLDPAGILFALAAACGWAGYIVLMRHVGRLFSAQEGLCLSLIIAAALALPAACFLEPRAGWLGQLPAVAGLAVLSPLLPFALEMAALRRMEMGTFSIVMSLEPAIGALFGFLILGQALSLSQICGVLVVMAASAGAVLLPLLTKPRCRMEALAQDLPSPEMIHQPVACNVLGE
jgi:inner membrane transporter RhtA